MNVSISKAGVFAAMIVGVSAGFTAKGELPSLDDRKWVGNFVVLEGRNFEFTLASQGKARISAMGKKGLPISDRLAVSLDFLVQETLSDGKIVTKAVQPASLESSQPATLKPKDIVIRGKVTGDAGFEAYITEDRGAISVGGKLLNLGTLTKNPLRFAIRASFPNPYGDAKGKATENDKSALKKEAKAMEKTMQKDRLQLKWIDGKSTKLELIEPVDASSKEVNGPGIAALSAEFSTYQDKKFILTASENSSMTLSNSAPKPLNGGFVVIWMADPVKDPGAKARLTVDVK
ncbi:MAG: hypothetical protein ABI600_09190 [Luteolibacter sp.]